MKKQIEIASLRAAVLDSFAAHKDGGNRIGEALRLALPKDAESADGFEMWSALDNEIGRTEDAELRSALIDVRLQFIAQFGELQIAGLTVAFAESSENGYRTWLGAVAEAISHYRIELCLLFCDHSFKIAAENKRGFGELCRAVRCIEQERWLEAYLQIDYLSRQEFISPRVRARLFSTLAQIRIFFIDELEGTQFLLDEAKTLAPDDARVLTAFGDLANARGDLDSASSFFESAIEADPGLDEPYLRFGMRYEADAGTFTEAEHWILKAIENSPGSCVARQNLMRLYGKPGQFEAHETEIHGLAERCILLSPESRYQVFLDLANINVLNKRFGAGREWIEKAIELENDWPSAYITIGYLEQEQTHFTQAVAAYKKSIDLAPDFHNGYWSLSGLYELNKEWQDALDCYLRVPRYIPETYLQAEAKAGEMQWKLGEDSEAVRMLKSVLKRSPSNGIALDVLENIAADYYEKQQDPEKARRIYADILDIREDRYRPDYHNRLGNLSYYLGDYAEALENYREAVRLSPKNAVFHRNLANSLKEMKRFDEAEQEHRAAFKKDADELTFKKEMALLINAQGNDAYGKGDYIRAIALYREAVKTDNTHAVIHANLGGAFEQSAAFGKNVEALEKALESYRLADQYSSTGEYRVRISALEKRLKFAQKYGEKVLDWRSMVTPISVEIAGNLIPFTEKDGGGLTDDLLARISGIRARVLNDFGIEIPGINFRAQDAALPDGTYVILIKEIPVVSGSIVADRRFCPAPAGKLEELGIKADPAFYPGGTGEGAWLSEEDWARVAAAGFELWDTIEYSTRHLEAVLRQNLSEFIDHQSVSVLLEKYSPATFESYRSKPDILTQLSLVCRSLLDEFVPVNPFGQLCEVFEQFYSEGQGLMNVAEQIRLSPFLRERLPGNNSNYSHRLLGPNLEQQIRRAVFRRDHHAVLAMEPEICQAALAAVREAVSGDDRSAVIVEDAELRPFVRLLLELEFPGVPVLSRRELLRELAPDLRSTIDIESETFDNGTGFVTGSGTPPVAPEKSSGEVNRTVSIGVVLSEGFEAVGSAADGEPIEKILSLMRDGLFYELGLYTPEISFSKDGNLEDNSFCIEINGQTGEPVTGLRADEYLVNETVERLKLLNISGRFAQNPANGNASAVVSEAETSSETCRRAGLTTWGQAGFVALALSKAVRESAPTFQTEAATRYAIDSLAPTFPALIETALRRFGVNRIGAVLCDLLREEISVRNLSAVLEGMLSVSGTLNVDLNRFIVFSASTDNVCFARQGAGLADLSASDYADFVRTSLKRYISFKYTNGTNTLVVYLVDPEIEQRISAAGNDPLSEVEIKRLNEAVGREVGTLSSAAQNTVVLTTMDVRRPFWRLIKDRFPHVSVLSYQELAHDTNIQPLARISWN